MNFKKFKRKYFKSTEEVVSMFLGLAIVIVVVSLIFNFFQRRKGNIAIPGATDVELSQGLKEEIDTSSEYVVKKGDNLWKVAVEQYGDGYQWVQIAKENNLDNPGLLVIGQKLILPQTKNESAISINGSEAKTLNEISVESEYKVVKGDSLWKIAVRAYGDGYQWVQIWQANKSKLRDPNGLEIGMSLTIPNLN